MRSRRLAGEIGRYLAVGLGATIVAVLIFNVLVHGLMVGWAPFNGDPVAGYVVANLIGMVISYRGTRSWVFRDRDTNHSDGGRTAYFVINTATMGIPMACLWLSRNLLGLDDPVSDNVSANVLGLALANATRFVVTRQVIFRVKNDEESTAGTTHDRVSATGAAPTAD